MCRQSPRHATACTLAPEGYLVGRTPETDDASPTGTALGNHPYTTSSRIQVNKSSEAQSQLGNSTVPSLLIKANQCVYSTSIWVSCAVLPVPVGQGQGLHS